MVGVSGWGIGRGPIEGLARAFTNTAAPGGLEGLD